MEAPTDNERHPAGYSHARDRSCVRQLCCDAHAFRGAEYDCLGFRERFLAGSAPAWKHGAIGQERDELPVGKPCSKVLGVFGCLNVARHRGRIDPAECVRDNPGQFVQQHGLCKGRIDPASVSREPDEDPNLDTGVGEHNRVSVQNGLPGRLDTYHAGVAGATPPVGVRKTGVCESPGQVVPVADTGHGAREEIPGYTQVVVREPDSVDTGVGRCIRIFRDLPYIDLKVRKRILPLQ